jgi:tetratricopeptide (TPR) repeat protein
LHKQWELFEEQEYTRALDETQALLPQLQTDDLRDAQRLLGLCCQRQGQHAQASRWFRQACQGSVASSDWLHLAVALVLQGQPAEAAAVFEQVRLCQQVARYAQHPGLFLHIYWYALALAEAGQWSEVGALLDELSRVYVRLHSTDSAHLYRHQVPFLGSTLALAMRTFCALEHYAEGSLWLQRLAQGLDDAGQRQVSHAMAELRAADEGGGEPAKHGF